MLEWYGTTSEVPWLFLLAAWVIALVAAAFAYAYWNRSGLRLVLAARAVRAAAGSPLEELPEQLLRTAPPPAAIFEGDELELEVGLETSGAPRGPASVSGYVGASRLEFGTGVVPRAGWRRTVDISKLRRGPLGAASWQVTTGDFLGLFRGVRRCPDVEVALVLPRFASLAGRRRSQEVEASTASPRAGSGSELFGIREYRPGDSLRRIHWRSSARHGALVVREYEPPGVHMLTLVVDPAPPSPELADQVARIAASEAWDCIREGGRVTILAPGVEPTQTPRDLWALVEWLARYPHRPSVPLAGPSPLRGEEVVAISAGDQTVLDIAGTFKGRAWVVGGADVEAEVPVQRVGVAWPL